MTEHGDLLGMMGITPSSFRVVADFEIGAVIVEIRDADKETRWCLTPPAADQLARALTTVRRRILDRRLLEDEEPT
jgi:hypothetical protein